jgi:hypothetical protein
MVKAIIYARSVATLAPDSSRYAALTPMLINTAIFLIGQFKIR